MKLYHFNPNTYGAEYFVIAIDKYEAFISFINHLDEKIRDPNEKCYADMHKETLELWKKVNPLDSKTFPMKYTLDEYEAGHVIQSEIA